MTRTVGVEEEFLLVGQDGAVVRPVGGAVAEAADRRFDADFEHELMREQAELNSRPHDTLDALAADLRERRGELARSAEAHGARLLASGTAPLAGPATITPDPRYERLVERYGAAARGALSCGMHVHVGVADAAEGVRVLNGIRAWLPVLLALSANSPFHDGADTGYASYRSVVWQQWPTAGPSGDFVDEADYRAVVDALTATGAALDEAGLYFDARLSARYPTVEIRVADVCLDVEHAVTIAGLARALVTAAAQRRLSAPDGVAARLELVRAGAWRAARYGMTDTLLHPASARPIDAWTLVGELAHLLDDSLDGRVQDVPHAGLDAIRRFGTGSEQQRAIFTETHDLAAVVDAVAAGTLR